MAEIKISFNLSFSRRFLTATAAAAMMLCVVPELDSESVTLSTYYPAPSGVYTNMITTGNTYLARDGGAGTMVGIGTTTPGAKLDVAGQANLQKFVGTGNNTFNTADPSAADIVIGSNAGARHDSSIMFWSNASASRIFNQADVFYLSTWNNNATGSANVALAAAVGNTSSFQGDVQAPNFDATSAVLSRQAGCTNTTFGLGVQALCAGQYVTAVDGFYAKTYILGATTDATGTVRCCPCPVINGATTCPI